jgi:hypothetical protein
VLTWFLGRTCDGSGLSRPRKQHRPCLAPLLNSARQLVFPPVLLYHPEDDVCTAGKRNGSDLFNTQIHFIETI